MRVMKNLRALLATAAVALAVSSVGGVSRAQTALTLTGWSSSPAEEAALKSVVEAFNAANPDIQATLNLVPDYDTTLAKDLSGGNPPDVFYVSGERFGDLAKSGQLAAIGDQLTNPDDFYASLKNAFTYDGNFVCPPKDFSTLALQYNVDMFEAAGIEPPTTWDEVAAAAEKLTTDDVAGIVLPTSFDRFGAFLYAGGGTITSDDFSTMTINTPESVAALKWYSDLYLNGWGKTPADLGAGWPGEAFGKGQAAMAFEGNWIVGAMKDQYPDINYASIEMPTGPGGEKSTLAFTVCYGTPANGKNQEAATKLIDYLTGVEGSEKMFSQFAVMPARASLAEKFTEVYPELDAYVKGAEYAKTWQFVPGWGAVQDEANAQIQRVFNGETTPEDAIAAIEKAGNDILAKANQ
jgi:multiple sugar transport system substrate-binding protein